MKCMTVEQIEERRSNLAFIRENAPPNELDDYTFTTTLKMQEEWLVTIDAARLTIEAVRARCRKGSWTEKMRGGLASDILALLSDIRGECTCNAPPPQPCSPHCKYPYTDCCGTTAACCRGGESEKWVGPKEGE